MPPTRRSTRPAAVAAPYARADRVNSQDSDSPAPIAKSRNVRSTRNPRTVIEPDSDEDEEMEDYATKDTPKTAPPAEESDDDESDGEMDVAMYDSENGEDDEEDESEDDDDDDDEDDGLPQHPPPPQIKTQTNSKGRPSVVVKPPSEGPLKSVEAKEMETAEDDDLSDLDSEGLPQELNLADDNDGQGEDEDEDLDGEEDDDDDDSDRSRSGTPDLTKLTRRQRGQFEEFDGNLIALSNEAQKKKHISAEEHAMRRAEMARRRKNLSEKRNEEEKIDTINKLLKKPAPKRRTRAEILAAQAAGEGGTPGFDEEGEEIKPDPVYVRWVNNSAGSRIGVPDEWLSAPIGRSFVSDADLQNSASRGAQVMVEEVA